MSESLQGWQPISTVPHDEKVLLAHFCDPYKRGEVILLWIASGEYDSEANQYWLDWTDDHFKDSHYHTVTHWMRLPSQPTQL